MPRPRKYTNTTTTSLTVDLEMLKEASSKRINMSAVFRDALSKAIEQTKNINNKLTIPQETKTNMKKYIRRHNSRAEHWAKVLKDKFDIDITAEELIEFSEKNL